MTGNENSKGLFEIDLDVKHCDLAGVDWSYLLTIAYVNI